MAKAKTYVLLDELDSNVPVYQVVSANQKIQLKKPPVYPLHLQLTLTTEDGKNRTLRYKANSNSIWLDEQIKDNILANEKFTSAEREARKFKNGIAMVTNETLQKFYDHHPGNVNFKGTCTDMPRPVFRELDATIEEKVTNTEFKRRLKAANKIDSLSLPEAQALLIRLYGSFYTVPVTLEACQNRLADFLDDAGEEGIKEILKSDEETTVDEKTDILIGKLVNAGRLSFSNTEGEISKLGKDGKWIKVRDMSNEYPLNEKIRLFSNWLNTTDGKALKADLEADLESISEKADTVETKKGGRPPKKID
jgi:hypothetical protein